MRLNLLAILLLLAHLSFGQEAWQSIYHQSQEQYQQGNLREGYQLAKQALVRARLEHSDNLQAHADNLRLLSLICYSSSQMHEGIQYAHHELKTRRQMGQEQQAVFGETLHNLALLQLGVEQYDSAILYLKKASSVINNRDGLLQVLYQLGRAYQASGQLTQSDSAYEQTIQLIDDNKIYDKLLFQAKYQQALLKVNKDQEEAHAAFYELKQAMEYAEDTLSKVYINTLCQLASQQKTLANPQDAISLYEKAKQLLAIARPIDSLQYAYVIDNLGMLRLSQERLPQGNVQQAEYFISRAHLIRSQYLSANDGVYWVSVDHMAQVLLEKKGSDEAVQFYEKSIQEASPSGLMPYQYAIVLNNLALLYGKQEAYEKAAACYHSAIAALQMLGTSEAVVQPQIASIYYNVARNFQRQSQFDSAIYFYKNAVAWSKEYAGKTSPAYRAGISSMAGLYQDIGYFTEAEIFYQEALQIEQAVSGEESNEYANLLNNYALLLQAKGDYQQAEVMLKRVLSIKKKLSDRQSTEILPAISNLGLLYLNVANYQKARPLLQEVLVSYQQRLPDTDPTLIDHLVNMAKLEIVEANYTKAEPLLKRASNIAESTYGSTHPNYAGIQLEMANLYLSLGNYSAAEILLQESRRIFQGKYGKVHPDYAAATQNLATLYEATSKDSLAEAFFKEALQIDLKILDKYHPDYAVSLNNLASFYQNTGYNEKALPLLEESLSISRNVYGKEHPSYIATLLNLSILYQDDEQYQKAEAMIEEALALRKKVLGELHPDYAYALYSKAVLYHHMKRYQEAIPIFHEAVSSYIRQIKAYFPALSEKEKSAFYKRIEPVLNAYRDFVVDVFVNEKYKDKQKGYEMLGELYNVQLITKAMLLNTSSKIRENILSSGDARLMQTYDAWIRQKEILAQVYTLSRKTLQEKGINISAIERKANELEKKLSAGSALFAQDIGFSNITWQDVQQQLNNNEAAVEIIRGQEQDDGVFYVALSVTPLQQYPMLTVLPRGDEMEGKNYSYYKNAITFRVRDTLSYDLYWNNIRQTLPENLHTVYVAPDGIYNKVSLNSLFDKESGKFLLDKLNIKMLSSTRGVVEDAGNTTAASRNRQAYLFGYPNYRFEISGTAVPSVVMSGSTSKSLQQPDKSPELLVGNNSGHARPGRVQTGSIQTGSIQTGMYPFRFGITRLPGTQREVNGIDEMLQQSGWDTYKFTENVALEENIKQVKNPDLLHIATHGYFMSDLSVESHEKFYGIHLKSMAANPLLRSGLLLAGAEQTMRASEAYEDIVLGKEAEDGILTAYEALNLDLRETELVVLSACETGLGDVRNGEGVYGLQRAFLVAGAKSVLMSLWKVNDQATTKLIETFYRNWLSGQDKFEALRQAQMTVKNEYKAPYYWGAFVLMGD